MSSFDQFPTSEDPFAGDVDRFVHPDETRTDQQVAYDEKYAIEPYDGDASDEYWSDWNELHTITTEAVAEEVYAFTEQDIADRSSAKKWLGDVTADCEKQRIEKFNGNISHYSGNAESSALARILENGAYATSDDNVYSAIKTIDTGNLCRAGWFSSWPDGSYKCPMAVTDTELDIDGIREFTQTFAELQHQREEMIAVTGADPLPSQMQDVFGTKLIH